MTNASAGNNYPLSGIDTRPVNIPKELPLKLPKTQPVQLSEAVTAPKAAPVVKETPLPLTPPFDFKV
jgi:hypothetical protein